MEKIYFHYGKKKLLQEIENEKKKGQISFFNKLIEVPKTGDNSHIVRFAGAIFFAILGVIYLVIKIFKWKDKE